jgi:methylglutaconyl-CoA hydratase
MLESIYRCDKPVIARIQGDCYAGGMGLIAACDIAIAAIEASFCLSEVRLGLIPAAISPYVIRAMGVPAARRYFLTAERFGAAEAARLGLVQAAVAADALDETVAGLAAQMLANSPNAMKEAKRLVRDVAFAPLDAALAADTAARIATIRASAEGREGVSAFLEKRKPAWAAAGGS